MPKGNCDPAPEPFNQETLTMAGCTLDVRYVWDGISTVDSPGSCDGPVEDVHLTNPTVRSAWALLPRKTRNLLWVEIPPGTDQTIVGNALRQAGLDTMAALRDMTITTEAPS